MKTHLTLITLLLLLPFVSEAKRKPSWVKQRPNDPTYYIGISTVAKTGNAVEYRQAARGAALKQMSSEIKVTISSNSVLHKLENDYQYKEEYESKVQSSIEQTLEGYEVFTWEDKKEYWVMTRLNKQKYAMTQRIKLDKAKMLAGSFLRDAQKAIDANDAYSALNYLAKGAVSLKDHLEEDLTYKTVDGTFNVGTTIFSTIQDVFRRVELKPSQSLYQIQFSKQLKVPITVEATFVDNNGQHMPLTSFPLSYQFTKGEGSLSSTPKTNLDGMANISITRLISKRKSQEITAAFDFSGILDEQKDAELEKLLHVFFPASQMPSVGIAVEVQKSRAYLVCEENIFGELDDKGIFSGMMKTELNENFFTFTSNMEAADFIVKIRSNFAEGEERKGKGYSVYLVFADFDISITDVKSQTEIFTDNLSGIKGMRPGNFGYALKDARIKLIDQYKKNIATRLEQVDM